MKREPNSGMCKILLEECAIIHSMGKCLMHEK